MNAAQHKELIKAEAQRLGFQSCGVAEAVFLEDDARRLEAWLHKGFHGKMQYMENHFDLRTDPRKLVPGARSVITLLLNYFPSGQQQAAAPKIAKYAWGTDYHYVIRDKLNRLLDYIRQNIGEVQGRGFVDSAPVLERSWALRSGLGWIGKNANLLTRHSGSFFFIATLVTDLPLDPDPPFATDHCGTCTRCIDACPTEAILPNKEIDATKCISYLTIELKDALLPSGLEDKMQGWAFGCDICQDVCPWNRFASANHEPFFEPLPEVLDLSRRQWQEMSPADFKKRFKNSPLLRTKWQGMQRNLKIVKDVSL